MRESLRPHMRPLLSMRLRKRVEEYVRSRREAKLVRLQEQSANLYREIQMLQSQLLRGILL